MKKQDKSFFAYIVGGLIGGYLSFLIGDPMKAFPVIVVLLLVLTKLFDLIMGKEKVSWWLKNGGAIYILISIVFWTFLYNIL